MDYLQKNQICVFLSYPWDCFFSLGAERSLNFLAQSSWEVIGHNRADSFFAQKEVDHFIWSDRLARIVNGADREIKIETNHTLCSLGQFLHGKDPEAMLHEHPEVKEDFETLKISHQTLHQSASELLQEMSFVDPSLGSFFRDRKMDHLLWKDQLKDLLLGSETIQPVQTNPSLCALGKWLSSEKRKELEREYRDLQPLFSDLEIWHEKLHASAFFVLDHLKNNDRNMAMEVFTKDVLTLQESVMGSLDRLLLWYDQRQAGIVKAKKIWMEKIIPSFEQVRTKIHQIRKTIRSGSTTDEKMFSHAVFMRKTLLFFCVLGILFGLVLGYWVYFSVMNVLRKTAKKILESSSELNQDSEKVSQAASSLASGAANQASSIEETTASMEEITAMVRSNLENASLVDDSVRQTVELVNRSDEHLTKMNQTMDRIVDRNGEIKAIMSTMNEIAFQTNLLALNAAVEAARAGEAGKGFAVVAEEVRSLARRAGDSSARTSEILERNITDVQDGKKGMGETIQSFSKVLESTREVASKISQIVAASREQTHGIEQVNIAITEIDKVTQANASNAEESSSAAEALLERSEKMSGLALELQSVIE